jgi:cytidine deaminase
MILDPLDKTRSRAMLGEMQALSNAVAGFPPGAGRKALIDLVAPLDFAGQIGAAQARFLSEASGLADDALLTALVPVAAAYARPPLSNVFIGAVARGASGAIHCGANIEFAGTSVWTTLHAEQAAVARAWAAGEERIEAIAIGAAPCGLCRQFLMELGDPAALSLLLPGEEPRSLADLLPAAFGPAELGQAGGLLDLARPQIDLDHPDPDPLTDAALAAARRSYAPYTRTEAGIAIRLRSGTLVTGSYAECAAYNPSIAPLAMALSQRVFLGLEGDEIVSATLVAIGDALIDHTAPARTLLTAVAPGVRLHLRAAHRG